MMVYRILFIAISILAISCQSRERKVGSETSVEDNSDQMNVESDKSDDSRKRIVCFGNSLTAGYGLEGGQSFPSLLQKRIDSLGLPYQVVNAGVSGETTSGGLNRIDWILNQPVEIFILELGANDVLRGLDLSETRANLQGILDRVKQKYPGSKLIIAGMKAPPNMGQAYVTEFEQIFSDLAKKNNADLLPFLLEGVAAQPELNLPDGIHPNVDGQKVVMENVWGVLAPHVEATF